MQKLIKPMGRKLGLGKNRTNQLSVRGYAFNLPPNSTSNFDSSIEAEGWKLKEKHPNRAAAIDRAVTDFKERNRAGEFHDWNDTLEEFIRTAARSAPGPPKKVKRENKR
jgi:hypothetical protein